MAGVVKPILKKAKQSGTDPKLELLCIRTTPLAAGLPSSAEMLYNRKVRSNLPVINESKQTDTLVYERLADTTGCKASL